MQISLKERRARRLYGTENHAAGLYDQSEAFCATSIALTFDFCHHITDLFCRLAQTLRRNRDSVKRTNAFLVSLHNSWAIGEHCRTLETCTHGFLRMSRSNALFTDKLNC